MQKRTLKEVATIVSMNDDAIRYIRDTMGYEDVVLQVITATS